MAAIVLYITWGIEDIVRHYAAFYYHRFCQRVIPVVKVCRATLGEIEKEAVTVLEPHFHIDDLQPLRVGERRARYNLHHLHIYKMRFSGL